MGIEQHQLAQPRTRHGFAHLTPHPQQSFRRQREGSGKSLVLGAQAQGLGWQHQHLVFGRQVWQSGLHHPVHQLRVHIQGQMRAMLFGGAQGQHGHRALRIHARKILSVELGPIT